MPMVSYHVVVVLDRDDAGVLQRSGEISFATPEGACAAAPHVMPEHAGAIVMSLDQDSETGDLGDVKVLAVHGEWDMAALFRDP